ncbi:hypothetical protein HAX54_007871, partial [Datura stramonium]|nr:hypothetical protein [Datura stramonium]
MLASTSPVSSSIDEDFKGIWMLELDYRWVLDHMLILLSREIFRLRVRGKEKRFFNEKLFFYHKIDEKGSGGNVHGSG